MFIQPGMHFTHVLKTHQRRGSDATHQGSLTVLLSLSSSATIMPLPRCERQLELPQSKNKLMFLKPSVKLDVIDVEVPISGIPGPGGEIFSEIANLCPILSL